MEIRSILALFSVILLVFAAACDQKVTDPEPPTLRVDEAVAAYINGEPVTIAEVRLEAFAQGVITPGERMTREHPEFDRLLVQLIDQRLLAQEAVRLGLDQASDARYRLTIARERILRDLLAESLVAEEDVQRMYLAQAKLQQLGDEVRVSQIRTATKEAASDVREQLLAGGDFASLAFEFSTDTRSRINGGLMGYVEPNDLPDPFPAIIANTKTGELSRVFESKNGWHVLRVEDRREKAPLTLAEMRPRIVEFLIKEQLRETIETLREQAVVRDPANLPDEPATEEESQDR